MGGGGASAEDFIKRARQVYGTMADEFLKLYPATTDAEARESQAASGHDRLRAGLYLWAASRAKTHHSPVFAYYFDRAIPWPAHPEFGAFHSGELPYGFGNLSKLDRPWEPVDYQVSKMMMSYWIQMAASGNPNSKTAPDWAPVDPSKPAVMRLGADPGPIQPAEGERFDFWKRYFESAQSEHASPF
jgi:para-nitrobenzyl esterase